MEVKIMAAEKFDCRRHLRVAAYARVSNEDVGPAHSLEAQIAHYTEVICANTEWVFAGAYSDGFISGTGTEHRVGFMRLIKDCTEGKIDIILCKSVSRFSRNTVDLLRYCRYLKHLGVDVQFEKEGIATLSEEGELMLSLLASFAQEESRSISENIKWGIRKGFEVGRSTRYKLYGYFYDGREYRIVEEEAEVIRRIYAQYLDGGTAEQLEKIFLKEGIKGPKGGVFRAGTIRRMLSNITYTGSTVLQREYIENHITHKRRRNNGELAKYIVEGSHPVIIPADVYDSVQREIQRRRELGCASGHFKSSWHTQKMYCGECGASLRYVSKAGKNGDRCYGGFLCKRRSKYGKNVCRLCQIPEKIFYSAVEEVLDIPVFTREEFKDGIVRVVAYSSGLLRFELTGGEVRDIIWERRGKNA